MPFASRHENKHSSSSVYVSAGCHNLLNATARTRTRFGIDYCITSNSVWYRLLYYLELGLISYAVLPLDSTPPCPPSPSRSAIAPP